MSQSAGAAANNGAYAISTPTLFGHPTGLFNLFFAEMWERFSYYGMRALLILYMTKGFLGFTDSSAYTVYGAYVALVYMTPFFGGMLSDRLLGPRRAVMLGGLLMATGQLMLTIYNEFAFFAGLGLLITGNGFFKPNISTMVGSLYPQGNPKRDSGFTIFYMGINLGATMSPLLCGYIGEVFGWRYGFGLATIGMLIGLAVFVAPRVVTQVLIMLGALAAALGLFLLHADNPYTWAANIFTGLALLIAAAISWMALSRGGLPAGTGRPADPERLRRPLFAGLPTEFAVYLGALVIVPLFILFVSGFALFTADRNAITLFPESAIKGLQETAGLGTILAVVLSEASKPAGLILILVFVVGVGYICYESFRLNTVPRQRMYVVLILTFFSMLFWALFEQAGTSVNLFTDRNVNRVQPERHITDADVHEIITFRIPLNLTDEQRKAVPSIEELPLLTQEQLGRTSGDKATKQAIAQAVMRVEKEKAKLILEKKDEKAKQTLKKIEEKARAVTKDNVLNMTGLTFLREDAKADNPTREQLVLHWRVTRENVGMGVGGSEVPTTQFQAVNPVCILLFGIPFSALWSFLATRRLEPSTPVKFSLGLLQLGLGFVCIWYGAQSSDPRGMVAAGWLVLGYVLHTMGELCLSPVGLSMVTKLSPGFLVSTVMGMWFMATALSQILMTIIAQFTAVGGDIVPPPVETVHLYGDVFGQLAVAAVISSVICLALSPLLSRWMHQGVTEEPPLAAEPDAQTAQVG
jgi:POT family proton-dependent oligopeptide transporter